MSKQYYRYDEIVDCMKAHALDLIGDELNSFSEDTGEAANIAFRNRVAGIIDLINYMDTAIKETDDDE